ncbi:hypothetical protein AN478_04780 [Thiohalorhabdus denitrificans]|uniref:Uncharacterized protein n=1 Tax=Thiohalorhabdus denitrificans TaxID=381306 RepID=A0A0P9CEA5_9GAMM|nr:hypothetical protein [Thiohalorhabdus denitrificans]KPV41207.1 hypothetical protein AN478_04780 [Thiohalorhabdus denitrificans]SCY63494.1 hypothetical protein SAMN05661077_2765 [Thiohalorhabdus denitrificans]
MSQPTNPSHELNMLVTIYVQGLPVAMCVAERASREALRICLSAWTLYPHAIDEVELTRETAEGLERHRLPVRVDRVVDNRAQAVFQDASPRALQALDALLEERAMGTRAAAPQADTA